MTSDDGGEPDEPGPEDTFALVGNEIRAAILRTFGDAWEANTTRPVLSFSELRRRVDVEVRSSQFNYHLQQLVGQLVERTDEGYRLRPAGTALYRAIRAETFVRDAALTPFEVGLECYFCGMSVTADYRDGHFSIQCPGCEYRYLDSTRVLPSGIEDTDTLLSRIDRHDRHKLLAFADGVCPICANALDRRLLASEEAAFPTTGHTEVFVFHACDHCGNQDYRTVGEALLYRPEVVCFFADRDVNVTTPPTWELEFAATDRYLTVHATDPWEVTLRLECDGDICELTVDDELSIVDQRDS
jgi:hypothetical protein